MMIVITKMLKIVNIMILESKSKITYVI